jgi:cob(I)alamin adenosyltransferase
VNSSEFSQIEVDAELQVRPSLSLSSDVSTEPHVGLIEVLSDHGWMKKSSGLDVLMRAMGHGMQIAVVEFMSGGFSTSEIKFMRRFPKEISFYSASESATFDAHSLEQSHEQAVMRAQAAWQQALLFLRNPSIGLLVLSELNVVLNLKYLNVHNVVQHLLKRPLHQHVLITGGEVLPELMEVADSVSELRAMKYSKIPSFD